MRATDLVMPNYKIKIAYDGTDYFGWQVQPDKPTVAGTLESIFKSVFKTEIKLVGASRTDTGVHALGQIARFSTEINITPEKLLRAWNNLLPGSLLIRSLELAGPEFHPQHHVAQKTYFYHLFLDKPLPILSRYGWYCKTRFDPDKLQQALEIFIGTHDFRSFCTGYERESTVRTIDSIKLRYLPRYRAYRIEITGPGFLRYMIRRIVGACVEIASSPSRTIHELHIALEQKNPEQQLFTAPAQGLMLYKIIYSS